jgi:splicing factor 3A subunit 3
MRLSQQGLGLERLKAALMALGVKCGGSLDERADRLFSLKGVKPKDIPQKLRTTSKK